MKRIEINRREFVKGVVASAGAVVLANAPELTKSVEAQADMVYIGEGFGVSANLAASVDYSKVETVTQTTIHQENTIGKGTEQFLAKVGGNLTIDPAEATRADLGGQVQLIMPGVTQGNFDSVGEKILDAPERGWFLLHSGTGGMSVRIGPDRLIEYPAGTPDQVILVVRGPYGIPDQDTNENRRLRMEVTDANAGNVLWQRIMAPWKGNIGFITQAWFAKEIANAHAASPNRGADGNSKVLVLSYDTNTGYLQLLRSTEKKLDTLEKQIEASQDPNNWTQEYQNVG
ncbi:MAG: hypothetical protein M1484_04840 [Patescibacteria group bacterium]|nr:hypothetical protein [Patescibacteria group bacterium]